LRDDYSDDPISRLREWEDHMWNPGYWVNRFSPFFPPKPSKGFWILALIDAFVIVPTTIVLTYFYFIEGDRYFVLPLLFMIALAIVAVLREYRLRPNRSDLSQQELERRSREEKREKKKLPKRRKDYR
jgi:hypothetical protein